MTRRTLLSSLIAPIPQLEARDASAVELDPEKRYLILLSEAASPWATKALHEHLSNIGVEAVVMFGPAGDISIYKLEASK